MERIAIFIDGPSFYKSSNLLGYDLDYGTLRTHFVDPGCHLFRAYYFTVVAEDAEFEPVVPLIDFLEYNGFTICARVSRDQDVSLATEIAVKALTMAPHYDCAVIVSGDAELVPLAQALADMGKRVVVAHTIKKCSDELRRAADWFVDLDKAKGVLARAPKVREAVPA